jgi:hypothetical protein
MTRKTRLKHLRDKSLAHVSELNGGISLPQTVELMEFSIRGGRVVTYVLIQISKFELSYCRIKRDSSF